jgi:hypothetical protein
MSDFFFFSLGLSSFRSGPFGGGIGGGLGGFVGGFLGGFSGGCSGGLSGGSGVPSPGLGSSSGLGSVSGSSAVPSSGASCASCLLFLAQAQNRLSQLGNIEFIIRSPARARISEFIKIEALQKPLLDGPNGDDGLVSMIESALTGILSDLREQIYNSPDRDANLVKFNDIRSKLADIIQNAITGNYKVGNDKSIPLFMKQLAIINELWSLTRSSHQ